MGTNVSSSSYLQGSKLSVMEPIRIRLFELPFCSLADLGDTSSVLKEFDSVLYDRTFFGNPSGLVDAASLLWRLNVIGVDPGEKRWEKVIDGFSKYTGHHTTSWLVNTIWNVL